MLPCCVLVQLCSTAGNCELFTLRLDQRTNEFDAGRISGTRLPSLVASSAVGTCRINTVAVSYSGIEPSTSKTLFTKCNAGNSSKIPLKFFLLPSSETSTITQLPSKKKIVRFIHFFNLVYAVVKLKKSCHSSTVNHVRINRTEHKYRNLGLSVRGTKNG